MFVFHDFSLDIRTVSYFDSNFQGMIKSVLSVLIRVVPLVDVLPAEAKVPGSNPLGAWDLLMVLCCHLISWVVRSGTSLLKYERYKPAVSGILKTCTYNVVLHISFITRRLKDQMLKKKNSFSRYVKSLVMIHVC